MHASTVSIIANYFRYQREYIWDRIAFLLMVIPITLGLLCFRRRFILSSIFSFSLFLPFSQRVSSCSFASPTKIVQLWKSIHFHFIEQRHQMCSQFLSLLILRAAISFRVKNENRKFRFIFEIQHILFILMMCCCCRCIVQHGYKI